MAWQPASRVTSGATSARPGQRQPRSPNRFNGLSGPTSSFGFTSGNTGFGGQGASPFGVAPPSPWNADPGYMADEAVNGTYAGTGINAGAHGIGQGTMINASGQRVDRGTGITSMPGWIQDASQLGGQANWMGDSGGSGFGPAQDIPPFSQIPGFGSQAPSPLVGGGWFQPPPGQSMDQTLQSPEYQDYANFNGGLGGGQPPAGSHTGWGLAGQPPLFDIGTAQQAYNERSLPPQMQGKWDDYLGGQPPQPLINAQDSANASWLERGIENFFSPYAQPPSYASQSPQTGRGAVGDPLVSRLSGPAVPSQISQIVGDNGGGGRPSYSGDPRYIGPPETGNPGISRPPYSNDPRYLGPPETGVVRGTRPGSAGYDPTQLDSILMDQGQASEDRYHELQAENRGIPLDEYLDGLSYTGSSQQSPQIQFASPVNVQAPQQDLSPLLNLLQSRSATTVSPYSSLQDVLGYDGGGGFANLLSGIGSGGGGYGVGGYYGNPMDPYSASSPFARQFSQGVGAYAT